MLSPLLTNTLPIAKVYTSPSWGMTFVELAGPAETDYREMTIEKIASYIPPHIHHVSIEGDEPLMHGDQLGILLSELTFQGKTIYLETSGIIDPPNYWKTNDRICWSFKSF